jgi:hypothetical protein
MHVIRDHRKVVQCGQPGKTRHRYLLGVKWSQVQILSARPELAQVEGRIGGIGEARPLPHRGMDGNADGNPIAERNADVN